MRIDTPEGARNAFTYHAPRGNQPARYEMIRRQAHSLASSILVQCPECQERTLALRALQEAAMWANASIALNEDDAPGIEQADEVTT